MKKINYILIAVISIVCSFDSCVYGMKDEKNLILPAHGEPIPQEILEQVFSYVCNTPIDRPLIQKPGQFGLFSYVPSRCKLKIASNGIVGFLAKMRSVCKHWYDNLLSPAEIKRRLSIKTNDIVNDLAIIKVFDNQQNYFYVQFLAQMIQGTHNACNHLVPYRINSLDDINKIQILLECKLIELTCKNHNYFLSGKKSHRIDMFINRFIPARFNVPIATVLMLSPLLLIMLFSKY